MRRRDAFTVIELLVVIAIIAVLVGLLFPAIGAVQRHAKQTESNTHVRNIVQGLIQASESRRGFFPGFDGSSFISDGLLTTGNSGNGQTAEARFWILLDGNFTSADQVISPVESKINWTTQSVTVENYSYTMLQIADSNNLNAAANLADRYRREEWRNEQNALAPIVADRLVRVGPGTPSIGSIDSYLSIHDGSEAGNWIGSVGRGDLSVEFSSSPKIPTRIAGYTNVDSAASAQNNDDDIFDAGDSWAANAADTNKNAAMTYEGYDNPAGQAQ